MSITFGFCLFLMIMTGISSTLAPTPTPPSTTTGHTCSIFLRQLEVELEKKYDKSLLQMKLKLEEVEAQLVEVEAQLRAQTKEKNDQRNEFYVVAGTFGLLGEQLNEQKKKNDDLRISVDVAAEKRFKEMSEGFQTAYKEAVAKKENELERKKENSNADLQNELKIAKGDYKLVVNNLNTIEKDYEDCKNDLAACQKVGLMSPIVYNEHKRYDGQVKTGNIAVLDVLGFGDPLTNENDIESCKKECESSKK